MNVNNKFKTSTIFLMIFFSTLSVGLVQAENQPPIANAGGDYGEWEGTAVEFYGFTSIDPDGDPLQYRWDFQGDSIWDTEWSFNPFSYYTYYDDYDGTVYIEVTDGEYYDVDSANIHISNANPEVYGYNQPQGLHEGELYTFSAQFYDPGTLDTHYIWWEFGDGTFAYDTLTPTHAYADDGFYYGTLWVEDDDLGVGTQSLYISVANAEPIISNVWYETVSPGVIPPGTIVEFKTTYTDPGWKDRHDSLYDFGDGTTGVGTIVEEREYPDSTGIATVSHSFENPGIYTIMSTISDRDGGATTESITITISTVDDAFAELNSYIQSLPDEAFIKNPDRHKVTLERKILSIHEQIVRLKYNTAIKQLYSIRSKVDGEKNDWIIDPEAQEQLKIMIDQIITSLQMRARITVRHRIHLVLA